LVTSGDVEGIAQNTPQIFIYSMSKLSLFEGEQKRIVFVSVPLKANELLLPAQRVELQQLVSLAALITSF